MPAPTRRGSNLRRSSTGPRAAVAILPRGCGGASDFSSHYTESAVRPLTLLGAPVDIGPKPGGETAPARVSFYIYPCAAGCGLSRLSFHFPKGPGQTVPRCYSDGVERIHAVLCRERGQGGRVCTALVTGRRQFFCLPVLLLLPSPLTFVVCSCRQPFQKRMSQGS